MAQSSDSGFGRTTMRNGNGTAKHSEKTVETLSKKTVKSETSAQKASPQRAKSSPPGVRTSGLQTAETPSSNRLSAGIAVARQFTTPQTDPLDAVVYERRSSVISNPDGSIVFKM